MFLSEADGTQLHAVLLAEVLAPLVGVKPAEHHAPQEPVHHTYAGVTSVSGMSGLVLNYL